MLFLAPEAAAAAVAVRVAITCHMSGTEERRKSARQKQRSRPSKYSSALESLRAAREGRESRTEQFEVGWLAGKGLLCGYLGVAHNLSGVSSILKSQAEFGAFFFSKSGRFGFPLPAHLFCCVGQSLV